MRSFDQTKEAVQISCDKAQLPRTPYERSRERLTKYALRSHHLHFLCTLVDCTPEASQLKDYGGTVDLENLNDISF